jgi:hypothetical protein
MGYVAILSKNEIVCYEVRFRRTDERILIVQRLP